MCALARANREDIDRVTESLRAARRKRCHVFLATSPIHREFKLGFGTAEVVRRAVESIRYARESFEDVEYSAEDAARTEPEFLCEVVERVIEAGATTINIPDTVGYAIPSQFAELTQSSSRELPTSAIGISPFRTASRMHQNLIADHEITQKADAELPSSV